jgi:hypothetical protein
MKLYPSQLDWCNTHLPKEKWEVNSQGLVDVKSYADLDGMHFDEFPVPFGKIDKSFYCNRCTSLTSLAGAPQEVSGGFFCANCTSLTSLEGVPRVLGGNFNCEGCTSLNSFHKEVIEDYNDEKIDWATAYELIHRPSLLKAHSLGLI